jgi:hypothetical protein
MKTAHDIVAKVGRDAIKDRFGVKDRVIRHHVERNLLPSEWFAALCDMAKRKDLPRHLFTFRGMS